MHVFSIILLGIAANLDNLGVGLSYGLKKVKVPFVPNLFIALISGLATLSTSLFGKALAKFFPLYIGNVIGGSIVVLVGLAVVISFIKDKLTKHKKNHKVLKDFNQFNVFLEEPCLADIDSSGDISLSESILLGVALGVNCLGAGLGAGMTGINIWGITLSVTFFSILTIWVGVYVGKHYASKLLGPIASLTAGLLLVIIGIYEIIV